MSTANENSPKTANFSFSQLCSIFPAYPLNTTSLFGIVMALWQGNSRRSKTGRRLRSARGKRKFEIGREPHLTTLGNPKTKNVRTKGDNKKIRALTTNAAYIVDQKTGKTTKTEITSVIENSANIHYIRRNIMNKGAIIDTKLGKAKITSRPGQSGTINAVLLTK